MAGPGLERAGGSEQACGIFSWQCASSITGPSGCPAVLGPGYPGVFSHTCESGCTPSPLAGGAEVDPHLDSGTGVTKTRTQSQDHGSQASAMTSSHSASGQSCDLSGLQHVNLFHLEYVGLIPHSASCCEDGGRGM